MIQAPTKAAKAAAPSLRVRNLVYAYREGGERRVVLDGVDLDVEAGECIALLGRSGSGKSTLLNLIGGIDLPSSGSIQLRGRELTTLDERARTLLRRRDLGFVQQTLNLIPELTVEENLRLPLELNDLAAEAAHELLGELGLADRAAAWPDRLSGGEQQRVAIARALVHRPSLVLADEPTGSLDAATGHSVLALLHRMVRDAGGMLILVTHSREVAATADRVLTLADGRLHALEPGSEGAAW